MRARSVSLFLCIAHLALDLPALSHGWSGEVVDVADGDTITVLRGKERIKVRLYGIDTPENGMARMPSSSPRPRC
jgi:endonuclease YncB( thermonuclease family)